MTEDEHAKAKLLIDAIDNHRAWLGTTSRELRDEVQATAKEINALSTGIEKGIGAPQRRDGVSDRCAESKCI